MSYNVFDNISEIPEKGMFKVVMSDKEDQTIFNILTLEDGQRCGDIYSISLADVDINPLSQISSTDIVWVERGAICFFNGAKKISSKFLKNAKKDKKTIDKELEEEYLNCMEKMEDDNSCSDSIDNIEDYDYEEDSFPEEIFD